GRPTLGGHWRSVRLVHLQERGRRLDRCSPLLKRVDLEDDSELSIMRLIDEHLHPAMEVPPAREGGDEQQSGRPAQRRGIDLARVDDDVLHEDGETSASRARYEVDIPAENPGLRDDGEPKGFRSDDPLQDGVELHHIFLAPHARRPELELRNHGGDAGRRRQAVTAKWTWTRSA